MHMIWDVRIEAPTLIMNARASHLTGAGRLIARGHADHGASRGRSYTQTVTLNITVLTPIIIYQSGDFRLTDGDTGALITDKSAKTVSLVYRDWSGLVTYTGLGSWEGKAVSAWIAEWLATKGDLTMSEVAEILESEGTKLLDTVHRRTHRPRMRHTFTLAGLQENTATVLVISNYQDSFGRRATKPADSLSISYRALRPEEKALVLITGRSQAVDDSDRRLLKRLALDYPEDGGRLRRRIEEITAKAAASPNSAQLISKDCVVLSFRIDGSGVLQLNSEGENPTSIPQLMHGINIADQMRDLLKSLGVDPSRTNLVQAASAATGRVAPPQVGSCLFSVVTPESGAAYRLEELETDEVALSSPSGISNSGHIVGTGHPSPGYQHGVPWLYYDGQVTALPYSGNALAVNNHGDVAGTRQDGGASRAVLFSAGQVIDHPLYHGTEGAFAGTDSTGRAINDNGVTAGNVRSQVEEQGRPNTRPAIFRAGELPVANMDITGEYGSEALRINSSGLVLVLVVPAIFDGRSVIWNPADGAVTLVGGAQASVHPIAINDHRLVLGQARDDRARPIAMLCEPGGTWQRLGTDAGFAPTDMNVHGDVVGMATVDRLQRPWLRLRTGEIVWLPYVREHHCSAAAINDGGEIVGNAGADHGSHALKWTRVE
jgi:hypothetical protein